MVGGSMLPLSSLHPGWDTMGEHWISITIAPTKKCWLVRTQWNGKRNQGFNTFKVREVTAPCISWTIISNHSSWPEGSLMLKIERLFSLQPKSLLYDPTMQQERKSVFSKNVPIQSTQKLSMLTLVIISWWALMKSEHGFME